MNPFIAIAIAIRKAGALPALRQQEDAQNASADWWTPHRASEARRNTRALNRSIGHRQAKRQRMTIAGIRGAGPTT